MANARSTSHSNCLPAAMTMSRLKYRMNSRSCGCLNCITPPHLLKKLAESNDKDVRRAALKTLMASSQMRGRRSAVAGLVAAAPGNARRTIFDCQNGTRLSDAAMQRSEDGAAGSDDAVNRAFDGLGTTRDFYNTVFSRNSLDDRGMRLEGYVHYDTEFNNAFFDGQVMVFGDGDEQQFTDFSKSLDVIAHELTHGVTAFTADLTYHNQSGALNESMSDVFGSLVKQWSKNQTAAEADWLIGAEVFTPGIEADALRSLKEPGKAYDNPLFGKDPQPDHMNKYVNLPDTPFDDNGGVHINSGIPNKAFFLTATNIGGFAWEAPGRIWYEALKASTQITEFQEFADRTHKLAGDLFGAGGTEQDAVLDAWREVGIRITGAPAGTRRGPVVASGKGREANVGTLAKQIQALSAQVTALAKDVSALKARK
jgi:Zn-dependent metalloprotease